MKGKSLLHLSLAATVIGISIMFFASRTFQPSSMPIYDIDFDMVGRPARTTGYVTYRTDHDDGHIFLTISDSGSSIQVPLFSSFVGSFDRFNSQKADSDDVKKGALIEVSGTISEYKGQLQLIPKKPDDLRILYD